MFFSYYVDIEYCGLSAPNVATGVLLLHADDQRRPSSNQTGYIVSIFRVMEGDDRASFERDWLSWTGEVGRSSAATHTDTEGGHLRGPRQPLSLLIKLLPGGRPRPR